METLEKNICIVDASLQLYVDNTHSFIG